MLEYFLNLSIKHCLAQFWAKFLGATVTIKYIGVLTAFRQSRNERKIQHNLAIFLHKHPIKKFVL